MKLKSYSIVSDAVEGTLGFALNRIEDATDRHFSEDERNRIIPSILNEIMIGLDEVITWEELE